MNRKLSPAWTLAILTGLNLFNYIDRFVVSAVVTPLQGDLHIDDTQTGWIASAFIVGYFVTSPFFGYLGDRYSRKWLIAAGIFVWSLGTILTGLAGTFAVLIACRVLVGFGEASYATLSPGLISDNFEPARRNNALTVFYVAIPVGAALGTFIGGEIAKHYSWRDAFIWTGAPGLLLALVLLPFREAARGQAEGKTEQGATHPGIVDILKLALIPKYLLVVLGYTAYTFALGAFGFWGPSYLIRVRHVAIDNSGTFFGIILAVSGLAGTFAGGFAATAWQKRNRAGYAMMLALSALSAVPLVVLTFVTPRTDLSIICLGLSMFLLFLCTGPVNTLIVESVPVNLRSSAMALSIFMIHLLGDWPSPVLIGYLSDYWHSLQKALLILPGMLLFAGFLWLMLVLLMRRENPISVASPAAESHKGGP